MAAGQIDAHGDDSEANDHINHNQHQIHEITHQNVAQANCGDRVEGEEKSMNKRPDRPTFPRVEHQRAHSTVTYTL